MSGQTKFLLDSNSYLRLACSIHPLLSVEFGQKKNCLYVCEQLEFELKWNSRLETKFHWVREKRYVENRKRKLNISLDEKEEIADVVKFLTLEVIEMDFPKNETIPSEVDLEVVATGAVLQIPIVTDDRAMHRVAGTYGVAAYSTLELLKLMVDCGHIAEEEVVAIGEFWVYEKDTPAKFKTEWKTLFSCSCPK